MSGDQADHSALVAAAVRALEAKTGAKVARVAARLTGRSLVVACEVAAPVDGLRRHRRIVLKTLRPDPAMPSWEMPPRSVAVDFETLSAVHRHGRLSGGLVAALPEPLVLLSDPTTLVMSFVGERPLRNLPAGAAPWVLPDGLWSGLSALEGAEIRTPTVSSDQECDRADACAAWFAERPARADAAGLSVDAIATALKAFQPRPTHPIVRHGDLTAANIMAGPDGLAFVDIADVSVGDATLDLASIWISLAIEADTAPSMAPVFEHLARAFATEWQRRRALDQNNLAFFMIRTAAKYLSWVIDEQMRSANGPPEPVRARISAARAWLVNLSRVERAVSEIGSLS